MNGASGSTAKSRGGIPWFGCFTLAAQAGVRLLFGNYARDGCGGFLTGITEF